MLRVIKDKNVISKEEVTNEYYLFTKYQGSFYMTSQLTNKSFLLVKLPSNGYTVELTSILGIIDYINLYMGSEIYVTTDLNEAKKYIRNNI